MKRWIFILMGCLLLISLFVGFDHCTRKKSLLEFEKRTLSPDMLMALYREREESRAPKQEDTVVKETSPILENRRRDSFPKITVKNLCVVQKRKPERLGRFLRERKYEPECCDTLYASGPNYHLFLSDIFSRTRLLTFRRKILLDNPGLDVFQKTPSQYLVETAADSVTIDFSKEEERDKLLALDKRDPRFRRFTKDYWAHISRKEQRTVFSFTMDFPLSKHPYANRIRHWLMESVNSSHVGEFLFVDSASFEDFYKTFPGGWIYNKPTITAEDLGAFSSRRYVELKKQEYKGIEDAYAGLAAVHDWRLCVSTKKFLTYQYYHFDYNGGAHGDFFTELRSYDFIHNEDIDLEYLFKADCLDSVKHLLLEEAMFHERFLEQEAVKTVERLYACFEPHAGSTWQAVVSRMMLPSVGLSEYGVVFSYPPYEIASYVSGCIHFVIPYGRLLPYLTKRAKWCLELG